MVDLAQCLFICVIEQRTAADEAFIAIFEKGFLFGVEVERVFLIVDRSHTGEEGFIKDDVAAEIGCDRADFFGKLVKLITAHAGKLIVEHARCCAEGFASGFHRFKGVLESGGIWVVFDLFVIGTGLFYRGLNGRHVMRIFDLLECGGHIGEVGDG